MLASKSYSQNYLQGGKEAANSNDVLHRIIMNAIQGVCPEVGRELVGLVTSREDVDSLLELDDVIDLVHAALATKTPAQWNTH